MKDRAWVKIILFSSLALAGGAIYFMLSKQHGPKQATIETSASWQANNFEAVTIEGERFSLSDLSKRPVVVHFWASWCGPCINEFPAMIRFIESFKGEIHLVALSADQSDKDIKAFLQKIGVNQSPFIHVIRDEDGRIAKQYLAKMLPTSMILGKELKTEKRLPGEVDWEDAELRTGVEKLIAGQSRVKQ